jgi:hypothetical protein
MHHDDTIRLFAKTLHNMERWLDKADAYAKGKSFDVDVLAQSRLAPDQYTFVRQVQSACDQAKYAAAGRAAAVSCRHGADVRRAPAANPESLAFVERPGEELRGPTTARWRRPGSAGSGCTALTI